MSWPRGSGERRTARWVDYNSTMQFALLLLLAADIQWPVNGGPDNIRYSPLKQITRANVGQLQPAWRFDSHDEFNGSEMQANPIVVDGVLYATTPKLRVVALDAATGRELWSFNPHGGPAPARKIRSRGVTVHQDRVFVTNANWLWAVDKKTGKPIQSFGDNGRGD